MVPPPCRERSGNGLDPESGEGAGVLPILLCPRVTTHCNLVALRYTYQQVKDAQLNPAVKVVGIDINEAMLTVARRVRPDIDWRQGDAGELPFPDLAFDAVLSQMALMYFPERAAALREMGRVAAAGGTVAVLVPSALDVQPAYGPLVDMAARHAGAQARSLLSTYFACGDLDELRSLFA